MKCYKEDKPLNQLFFRGRRLRRTRALRELCRETEPLLRSKLIMPYFVTENSDRNFRKEVLAMPGQFQLGLGALLERVEKAVSNGLCAVLLFGIPPKKDDRATGAWIDDGIVQQAVRELRRAFPDLIIITDVCLCEYMSHGHCGILRADGVIENDATLPLLVKTAVSHAAAGADIVAPSDMMDGRIGAIRAALDADGFSHVPVMSYAVKYASAFYGPFREAAESAPACGDRKSYQMNSANAREALLEAKADLAEGADMLIVKPAGPYSDILRLVRENVDVPLAAYQVSGEYSMIQAAALNGWIDGQAVMLESLLSLKRAGADMLITYFTEEILMKGLAF